MDVREAIDLRRAYRALTDERVSDDVVRQLAVAVQLSPSANNHQPWRFVFVRDRTLIEQLHRHALPSYNDWAARAAMIIAMCGQVEWDPAADENVDVRPYVEDPLKFGPPADQKSPTRELFLYDLGIASGFLILRATELGLVAHPIAGYLEADVRRILHIPDAVAVAALIVVGVRTEDQAVIASLPAEIRGDETQRPRRRPISHIAFDDSYEVALAAPDAAAAPG